MQRSIEDLSAVGYSISYDEIRRFLTSVAKDEIDKCESDVYIPRGISTFDNQDPSSMVHSAIDNFDQNEDNLDGKSSTHCIKVIPLKLKKFMEYHDSFPSP